MKPTHTKTEYINDGAEHYNADGSCRHNADLKDKSDPWPPYYAVFGCRYCPATLAFGGPNMMDVFVE